MNFKSRTLLAVTGLSPQIVTETLFAILKQYGEEALPNRVKILTTKEGANRARLTLLDKHSGKFHAFLREFSLEGKVLFTEQDIHLISNTEGSVLDDIVTPEDNAAAANCITNLMRQLTQDSESQLHVSIAGGRKTMGFYLGYAFSLFARPQDVLSHVLVASPFESHPEFFYPPTNGLVLYTQDKKPIHTDDAKIWLAEIPVVKLRHGVSAQHLQKEVSYTDVVQEVEQSFNPASVVIDVTKKKIKCGGAEVKLSKFHLIWFTL
jgi:CRISPR-associated protein (TIGR02584 family)